MDLFVTLSTMALGICINCHYAEHPYAECLLSVIILNVVFFYCHAESRYAEYRYAECRGADYLPLYQNSQA